MLSHPAERPRSGGYSAKLPAGTVITVKNGRTTTYKITSTGKLINVRFGSIPEQIAATS
jgi:predicted MarR family transcription regulator